VGIVEQLFADDYHVWGSITTQLNSLAFHGQYANSDDAIEHNGLACFSSEN